MRSRVTSLAALVLIILSACNGGATTDPAAPTATVTGTGAPATQPVELTVFGAASLKGALDEAKTAYESANAGVTVTLSTDSSAALATQIEQGAPADVFLSADTTNPRRLVDAGLADGDAVNFARNELTIIVPSGNPAGIATPADLATPGLRIIAAGDEVPITRYATELVDNLAGESGYPADFAAAYVANVASKEDNVKAVVARIELGEGDVGIVYVTDAAASSDVETVDVPASANVPASHAGVVLMGSGQVEAARAFMDWFAGPDGQAILSTFGFLPPAS